MHDPLGGFPILTAIIAAPAIGALIVFLIPAERVEAARAVGYAATAATFGLSLWMLWHFQTGHAGYQFVENERWMGSIGVKYVVGVDGISLFMIVLTALLFPIGLLASAKLTVRVKAFTAWMLLLEAALLGVFLSLDLIVFFVFFEVVLVPMYFIILGWGHDRRNYAALKFFLYTMAGSAFLLVGLLALGFLHQSATGHLTFDLRTLTAWAPGGLDQGTQRWLFLAFFAAFAVKVPLFPLHTWLPDAHTEAPTAGSVILAGVLLKMGTYGFLRFSLALFPQASVDLAPLLLVLGVVGIIYGAIVATMQPNLKRVVAYSSVAHLGFVVIGIFALTTQGLEGGIFTMISHGLTTGALFLLVGMLYDRKHTFEIGSFGGLWKSVPILGGLFCAAAFASIGLPGFSGFIGEFLSLIGTFIVDKPYAVIGATGVVFAAVYLLWAFQRVFMGAPNEENRKLPEINLRELACVVPLLALSLFLGLYPKPVLDRIEPSVKALIVHVERHSDYREPGVSNLGPHAIGTEGRGEGDGEVTPFAAVAPDTIVAPHVDFLAIAPVIALAGAGILVVLLRALLRTRPAVVPVTAAVALLGTLAAGGTLAWQWIHVRDHGATVTMATMVRVDAFAIFLGILVVSALFLALLLSFGYVRPAGLEAPEYFAMLMLSAAAMVVMTTANNLIVVFVALEALSIPLYVLVAFDRRRLASQEAGIKYFVLGSFASAVFLYGVALVYGATGSASLTGIATFLRQNTLFDNGTLLAGLALLIVGLGFKISAVPFHMWTPDVYQGAPSPVTAFMSSATKVAGFAAFLRIFLVAFPLYRTDWRPIIMALATVTLILGTVAAVVQTNLKRALAYSSIANAGYILIGFAAAGVDDRLAAHRGLESALFFLFTYTFMTIGAFAVVTLVGRRSHDARHGFDEYRGLARRSPVLAGFLTFFLLAQAGVPLTGGFVAKLEVFGAAVDAQEYWLAIIGALSAVVLAYFYLRVTVVVFAGDGETDDAPTGPRRRIGAAAVVVLVAAGVMVLLLGVLPGTFLHFARDAATLV